MNNTYFKFENLKWNEGTCKTSFLEFFSIGLFISSHN